MIFFNLKICAPKNHEFAEIVVVLYCIVFLLPFLSDVEHSIDGPCSWLI